MAFNPAVLPHLESMRSALSTCELPAEQRMLAVELLDLLESLHQDGRLSNATVLLAIESLFGIPELSERITALKGILLEHP